VIFRNYCGLDVSDPPKFTWQSHIPNVMLFGDGEFGRQLELDEDIRVEPS
jgi:hypothetical protein